MIFRPCFWHSFGAFCIAEKRRDEGRIAADPSRTSSFWRFAARLRQSVERARGGWLIGAASKTKPTASANFNECNQKNRFERLSGPNDDRSRAILTKEWVEIIRGQMSMRDQKLITRFDHARPRRPFADQARAQWSAPRPHCGPGSDKITLLMQVCQSGFTQVMASAAAKYAAF